MVVHQDDGAGRQLQGPPRHLARIDRGVIHRALAQHLIGDQLVLLVQEQHAELLARFVRQHRAHIGQKRAPGRDDRPLGRFAAPDAHSSLVHQLQIQRHLFADARHGAQVTQGRRQHGGQPAEAGQQGLGQGFDVGARD